MRPCPGRKNWKKCQAANYIKNLHFEFLDLNNIIQLKHHCPTLLVSHIFITESRTAWQCVIQSSCSWGLCSLPNRTEICAEGLSDFSHRGQHALHQQQAELVYPDTQKHGLLRLAAWNIELGNWPGSRPGDKIQGSTLYTKTCLNQCSK